MAEIPSYYIIPRSSIDLRTKVVASEMVSPSAGYALVCSCLSARLTESYALWVCCHPIRYWPVLLLPIGANLP